MTERISERCNNEIDIEVEQHILSLILKKKKMQKNKVNSSSNQWVKLLIDHLVII